MDGDTFRESVAESKRTELDRLGSSKLLIALTGARIERSRVLEVAAHSEHAARETFRAWAADESNPAAREAFEAVAEQEDTHLDRVLAALDEAVDLADGGPMHAYLRGREDTVERVASGMVGRPLVSVRAHNQIIGFFVNEAEEAGADLFRDLKAETTAVIDDGVALLDELCEDEDDWERAEMVAEYVIQVAYDDYADSLTEMGLGVKDIC
ncbi:rubrerythrin family protein [Salinigranum rubrum]|uniref:Rubrerythrin family protein n=1 Tax=Salinigranum rubrum TaxID=755307 RepID=A0A2I8VL20_9EURY|nr:rubrerythrin family protein [Salinigranum rubrum]AUV81779.1 rubrerythrin family protein [Salinigranum rubrum]